jgi:hypothetical protein
MRKHQLPRLKRCHPLQELRRTLPLTLQGNQIKGCHNTSRARARCASQPPKYLVTDMEHASKLIGTWRGDGAGEFPTIKPFEFTEEVTFERPNPGKPFLSYHQRTWSKNTNPPLPMHTESGFLRVFPDNCVEFCIAQPTGVAEIEQGSLVVAEEGAVVLMDTQAGQETVEGINIIRGERAKDPKTFMVVRRFRLEGDQLSYELFMATSTTPKLTQHLKVTMQRVKN